MQRPSLRTLTTSIYPLIGLAALMAMSGCAAVPMLTMANSLLKPAQAAQAVTPVINTSATGTSATGTPITGTPATGMPSPDIFSALAQRLGITLPNAQGTRTAAAQTGMTQTATTETATAASQ
jgi:hypothetical protein